MDEDDIAYFSQRAESELDQAQRATNPAAVKAHYILANYYLDRVYYPDEVARLDPA